MKLTRYWIVFERTASSSIVVRYGVGVTAFTLEDALNIIRQKMFNNELLPAVKEHIENIDVSTLDANHILPNMGAPSFRGIWYPLGYMDF